MKPSFCAVPRVFRKYSRKLERIARQNHRRFARHLDKGFSDFDMSGAGKWQSESPHAGKHLAVFAPSSGYSRPEGTRPLPYFGGPSSSA